MRFGRLALLGLLLLIALLAGGAIRRRLRPESPPSSPQGPHATAGTAPTPPERRSPPPAGDPRPVDPLRAFHRRVEALRQSTLSDVQRLLDSGGGAAALEHIARAVRGPTGDAARQIEAAFLSRLIPYVARKDPAAGAQAYALARDLLARPELDGWVRYQALAGLAGLPSSRLTLLSVGAAPEQVAFAFDVDEDVAFARTEWDQGLEDRAAADPSFAAGLPGMLSGDSEARVRELAALMLGRTGTPAASAALERALAADADAHVRRASAASLATAGPAAVEPLQRAARQDASADVRTAALEALVRAAPGDPRVGSFLAQAASDDAFAGLRPAVAGAAFTSGDPGVRPALTSLLLREAQRAEVVDVFVRESVVRGWAEFQPLFRALAAGTDPELRDLLDRGARRLEEGPRYAALAGALRDGEAALRGLWDEYNRPDTAEGRRRQIDAEIDRRLAGLARLRAEAER